MKTTSTVLAVLLLASPLLAAMGTYTGSTKDIGFTTASTSKVAWAKDGDKNTKFYVEIGALTLTAADNVCIFIGIPGADATATNWKGSDVGIFSSVYDATLNSNAGGLKTIAAEDNFCTATGTSLCDLTGVDATNGWSWVASTSSDGDKATYTTASKVVKLEATRTNAATDNGADLAIDAATTKLLIGYYTGTAACTAGTTKPAVMTEKVLLTGLTSPLATTTTSSSFGALTYLSWVALLVSYALLN